MGKELKSKIPGVLRHEKILKSIKEPIWRKSKPKAEVAKIRVSGFLRTDRVRIWFEIWFV
jgi:hypothetical protein